MDREVGHTDDTLTGAPAGFDDPTAWGFYAAVRALAAQQPHKPGPGRSTRIDDDPIRFRQQPSLRMEPSEVVAIAAEETPNGPVTQITQVFFGAFGAHGALPDHVTEDAIESERQGVTHLRDFLDLLNHRMTGLLYRAWETTQIAASRDRGGEDDYKRWLGALFGQGPVVFTGRDEMPDDLKRYMAGWMANPRGSVAAIESVLTALTGVPMKVDEFIGEWLPIPQDQQARLGVAPAQLGRDIILGASTYTVQSRIRVRTARMTLDQFQALLPDGTHHRALVDAMRNLVGLDKAWELQLVLDGQQVPKLTLDGTRRLGWDSWAIEENRFTDAVDVVLEGTYRAPPVPTEGPPNRHLD